MKRKFKTGDLVYTKKGVAGVCRQRITDLGQMKISKKNPACLKDVQYIQDGWLAIDLCLYHESWLKLAKPKRMLHVVSLSPLDKLKYTFVVPGLEQPKPETPQYINVDHPAHTWPKDTKVLVGNKAREVPFFFSHIDAEGALFCYKGGVESRRSTGLFRCAQRVVIDPGQQNICFKNLGKKPKIANQRPLVLKYRGGKIGLVSPGQSRRWSFLQARADIIEYLVL